MQELITLDTSRQMKRKKINLDFKFSSETDTKINNWKNEKVFFGVFPIKGDSMTCNDLKKSIPNESKVLAYDLKINLNDGLHNIWHEIPTNEPLLLIGKTTNGSDFFVCKTISCVDAVKSYVLLQSYNPMHESKWIPFDWITKILKVDQMVNV